ncbi:MAG: hypothetical protein QM677_04010 [Microbacterium sp.]
MEQFHYQSTDGSEVRMALRDLLRPACMVDARWARIDDPKRVAATTVELVQRLTELMPEVTHEDWWNVALDEPVDVIDPTALAAQFERSRMPDGAGGVYDEWYVPKLTWRGDAGADDPSRVNVSLDVRTRLVTSAHAWQSSAQLRTQGGRVNRAVTQNADELVRLFVELWSPDAVAFHDTALASSASNAGIDPDYPTPAYVSWLSRGLLDSTDDVAGATAVASGSGTLLTLPTTDPSDAVGTWIRLIDMGRLGRYPLATA